MEQVKRHPTDEQLTILDLLRGTSENILINALAGTGKTSTCEMMVAEAKEQPVLYMAFNKDVADEAREKLPSTCSVRTFNSMGFKCWREGNGKANVDLKKIQNLLNEELKLYRGDDLKELKEAYWDIRGAVGMARHLGYVPEGKFAHAKRLVDQAGLCARLENRLSPLSLEVVDNVLTESIKTAYNGTIDLDDQIYMPALFGGSYPRFPLVLVDEDQDLSPTNHALLDKICKSRVGAVGDRWQSIYYFRGAETNGVDKIKTKFNMTEMPLSVSFRCPKAIVEAAKWRVPHLKWVKDGGRYEKLQRLDPYTIPEGAAVICRNNAPLLRMAFTLLSRKRSVQIAGSDIGPKIIRLLRSIGAEEDKQEDLIFKINAWREEKLQTANSTKTLDDTAECLKIFATWGSTLRQAVGYAEHIFKQQGTITLTTGHKAKGREWNVVYHLDPWLLNSDDQDLNLRYVITTRAKEELYEINTKELKW